jgi:FlaA1/EpsC-like NDP-sugar epimerase
VNRRTAVIVHDLVIVCLAWLLANMVRYGLPEEETGWWLILRPLPVVVLAQGLVLWWSGLYRGLWRFASIQDLWNIARAAAVGVLAVAVGLFLYNRLEGIPRFALVFYPMFLVFLLGAPRLFYRMWKDYSLNPSTPQQRRRLLVLGAGRAGEMLVRDMLRDEEYLPVGILDDRPNLKGVNLHGVPVLGRIEKLPAIVTRDRIDIAVIAIPSATNDQMRRIVGVCERAGVPFRTLPRMQDVMGGRAGATELREVAIEDLLGREQASLDWQQLSDGLTGKTILVSGGGGSIGSELCRQIAALGPACLVLLERNEFNLYRIELELRRDFPNLCLQARLGDVTDPAATAKLFSAYRPQVVYHAAAYKHVPLLEHQLREALHNNVLGTKIIAEAADRFECETFVLVSTDKAVNPTNVMGASKRIAEVFCQNLDRFSKTRFITVRFGNVLGSAGSVVPLFKEQIVAGGPVTVTHKQMKRYFMTTVEACQLIMQAEVMGRGGEIFVLEMGEPIGIRYLAEQMICLSGKVPGQDIEIVYTGLRPGEKLREELSYAKENLAPTEHEHILLARALRGDWSTLGRLLEEMQTACECFDEDKLLRLVEQAVPEFNAGQGPQPAGPAARQAGAGALVQEER